MKTMYALTYCFEGYDDNYPYASTIAVSDDREKLVAEMNKCVEEDCREPEDGDEWNTDCNFQVTLRVSNEVQIRHNKYSDLYATYKIQTVNVL
jgi:hypothetical protein